MTERIGMATVIFSALFIDVLLSMTKEIRGGVIEKLYQRSYLVVCVAAMMRVMRTTTWS